MKLNRKYLVLATISGFIIAFDQLTKIYIHGNFQLGESVPVIQDIFHITYVRNIGAAFGIFRDMPETFRSLFFLSMPPIAMIFILGMLKGVDDKDRWQIFALSLIFGGAVGNYIDRLRFGFVVDFLDVHYKQVWSYPAFNIADSGIVCGVILLLYIMFARDLQEKRKREDKAG